MQAEILAANPASKIRILAVNDVGQETYVATAADPGHVVPILQDTAAVGAWGLWSVTYRDVVILDGEGMPLGVFNLTEHDLSVPEAYGTLLDFLRLSAGE
jgi:hypothetical protein